MESPAYWENKAIAAQDNGEWKLAADYWMNAKGASIGHNRRERYERWADRCLEHLKYAVE